MEMAYILIYTVLLVAILSYLFRMKHKRKTHQMKLKLPPGSMGWPYVGETPQLYSQDPSLFLETKEKRYGEIFKTHILGCPCVMLASPEAARFVLVTQAHLFKPTYPRSKEKMIGPSALFFHQGEYHTRVRKMVLASFTPEAIKSLVPDIEKIVLSMLSAWDGHLITTFHAMKQLTFDVGVLTIFGSRIEERYKKELKKNYFVVDKGYNSFPTIFPGTLYKKAITARKELSRIFHEIINERRKEGETRKDLLGYFMDTKNEQGTQLLTDDQISDNIIGILFAAQDTTASVLTWIIKYLYDNQKLLEAVKEEQMAIYESNGCGSQPLTWGQTRSMALTHRVILESLRMASIISFTFREAVADVEYKGYLIPKGWKVMPLFRNIHHNPEFFSDPQKFDPSRFLASPKPNTFLPFGNGTHACPGNELAKLEMFIFIHHLVTKYRLEVFGSHNEVEYSPFPVPTRGLPAIFRSESNCNNDDNLRR